MQASIGTGSVHQHAPAPFYAGDFDDVTRSAQRQLARNLAISGGTLFRVDAGDLFEVYLQSFEDPAERQYHNCNCCRSFIHRFGSLVTIAEDGTLTSALWDEGDLPQDHAYAEVVRRLRRAVMKGNVVDQFLWDEQRWGVPEAGGFTHLWADAGREHLWTRRDLTAGQAMAAKREDRRHLKHALDTMPPRLVERAVGMLQAGSLHRSDKVLPMAAFLDGAFKKAAGRKGEQLNRVLWRLVASAAAGWCTPRASVLGALVEDLQAGLSPEAVARKHGERMDPLKYQRPTAPTSAGNVAQAERLVEQLGIAPSLERRFAAADELVHLWTPQATPKGQQSGVFGHLLASQRPQAEARLTAKPVTMTFAKFRRDVLPLALEMDVKVPSRGSFCAFTTAVHRDAPPILQWDSEDCRNPFAWYVYHNGSTSVQWGLRGMAYARVVCISEMPTMWGGNTRWKDLGDSALLVLEGCRDSENRSLALFPECLRGELHQVRRTVEAHSRSRALEPLEDGRQHAAGLRVGDNQQVELRVRTAAGIASYLIDRWE